MIYIQLISIVAFVFGVSFFSGASLVQLINLESFFAIVVVTVPTVIASGHHNNIFLAIKILKNKTKKYTLEELKNAGDSLRILMLTVFLCAFCITIIGIIGIIYNLSEKDYLTQNLVLAVIPLFYSALLLLVILPMYSRIIILQNKAFGLEY